MCMQSEKNRYTFLVLNITQDCTRLLLKLLTMFVQQGHYPGEVSKE